MTTEPEIVATSPPAGVTCGEVTVVVSEWACSKSGDERPHDCCCWPWSPSSYPLPNFPGPWFLVLYLLLPKNKTNKTKKRQPETRWRLRTGGLTRTGSTHWNYASEPEMKQTESHIQQAQPTTDLWLWITVNTPPIQLILRERERKSWNWKLLYFQRNFFWKAKKKKKRWNLVHALLFWGILN